MDILLSTEGMDESPVLTKDLVSGALDTVYSGEEIATRRVNAIHSKLPERLRSITEKDAVKYMVYYNVCRTRYNGSHCDWTEHGYSPIDKDGRKSELCS